MTLRSPAFALAVLCICMCSALAQKSNKSGAPAPSASQAPPSQGGEDASSSTVGFSIETEMFTYKAVEQNSEIIACDVARFLSEAN